MSSIQPAIKIGFLTIHLYGLIIAIAIYLGYLLAKKRASIYRLPKKIFDDPILIIPLILAIAGARIYHVIDYWSIYNDDLLYILYVWQGGLGIFGALTGIILGFILVAEIRKLNFLSVLDLAAPSLLLGQSIGRIGNWINQEGFGPPTQALWSVYIDSQNRPPQYRNYSHFHPTFFYEAALDLIFFVVLLCFEKKFLGKSQRSLFVRKRNFVSGQLFALYLILYSTARFTTEFWRIDTATIGTLKVAQAFSIVTAVIGVILMKKLTARKIS